MAATSAFSAAERSYPTSEVRSRSQEDPIPKGRQPRGVTQCPRSGAAAESARLQRCRNGGEVLPHVRGQGRQPRGATLCLRLGAAAERSYPTSEARGGGWEELPHTRGQGRRPGGATPPPRSSGCEGTGGPRGATPCSRSEGAAVRRYPLSKVRETQVRR